ncbi:hypothetical protein XENOCAPTIV_023150, partial [Xenoophorus captivus]
KSEEFCSVFPPGVSCWRHQRNFLSTSVNPARPQTLNQRRGVAGRTGMLAYGRNLQFSSIRCV